MIVPGSDQPLKERTLEELQADPFLMELKKKRQAAQAYVVPTAPPIQTPEPAIQEPVEVPEPETGPDPADVEPALRFASGNPAEQVARDWDTAKKLGTPYSPINWDRAVLEEETRYRKLQQEVLHPSIWNHAPTQTWMQNQENAALVQGEMPALQAIGDARDRAIAADKARVEAANRAGRVSKWLSPFVSFGRGAVDLAGLPGDMLYLLTTFSAKLAGEPAPVREKGTLTKAKEYLAGKEAATGEFFVTDPVTGESYFNQESISISNAAKLIAGEVPSMAAMVGATALTGGGAAPLAVAKYGPWVNRALRFGKAALTPAAAINTARVAQSVHQDGIQYLMAQGQTEPEAAAKSAPGAILAGITSSLFGSPLEARIIEGWAASMASQPATASIGRRILTMLKQVPIQGTKEGFQEVLEGVGEDLSRWVTFQPDLTIKQATQNAITNAIGGAVVGGAIGAGLHAPMALRVARNTEYFQSLVEHAKNSKIPEDKLIEQIKVQAENGPELPSVDAGLLATLWQGMGLEPNQTASDLGIEGFIPALASGQEVQLSPAAFVRMAQDGTLDQLQADLRLTPGGSTQREEEAYQKDAERIKEQIKKGVPVDEAADPEFNELKDYLKTQLVAAGRAPDVAETESMLSAAALTNLTRRQSLSPRWIIDTYSPKITRPSPAEQGTIIQRAMQRVAPKVEAGMSPEEAIKEELPPDQQAEGLNWWETYFQGMNEKPVFYSALGRSIPEISKIADKQGMVDPGQAMAWLSARQKEGKFKQAELDAIGLFGLPDFIDSLSGSDKKQKIPVQSILNLVKYNGVKVDEIEKGNKWRFMNTANEWKYFETEEEARKAYEFELNWIYEDSVAVIDDSEHETEPDITVRNYDDEAVWTAKPDSDGDWFTEDGRYGYEQFDSKEDALASAEEYAKKIKKDWESETREPEISDESPGKFSEYTLPGGENYKELLLTLPGGKKFSSSHFDEKNILAHVRFNERTDSEGKKVLFIEEIQSDWAQRGKKEGFDKVPKAPFVTDTKAWVALAIKRMMRYAVDSGFDKIAFINGEQSADRYDLSEKINSLYYKKNDNGNYNLKAMTNDDTIIDVASNVSKNSISDWVGNEVANKIINEEGATPEFGDRLFNTYEGYRQLKGIDLKVGGEGMKTFYDVIVSSVAKETARKLGGKLGESTIDFDGDTSKQVSIEITPEMAAKIQEGLPLFQRGGGRYASKAQKDAARARIRGLNTDKADMKNMSDAARAEMAENQAAWERFDAEIGASLAGDVLAEPRKGKKKGQKPQEPLGFFQYRDLGDEGGKRAQMGFLEKADLTTFIHENTHFLMRVMRDLASREGATEQIKADWQTLLDFAGSKDGTLTIAQEEMLAEAGEKYLLEGKAPSNALKEAFARVKSWLHMIYELLKARRLDIRLNNDVRTVFDRIYASDQEIEEARATTNDRPLLSSAEDLNMTESRFQSYLRIAQKRIDEAKERNDKKRLSDLVKERQDFLEVERERLEPGIEAEVSAEPVYVAMDALSTGKLPDGTPIKLFKPALVAKYGAAKVKDLPRNVRLGYKIQGEGSIDADGAAELLGFQSGDALMDALTMAEKKEIKVQRLVDERVKQLHGDPLDPALIAEAAQDSIHAGDPEEKIIELREFRRAQREAAPAVQQARKEGKENADQLKEQVQRERQGRQTEDFWAKGVVNEVPPMSMFKDAAKEIISGIRILDINPNKYLTAQRKFSGEAFRALANKDYGAAGDAKEKELLNHFLYREARKLQEFEAKVEKYVRKFFKPSAQQRIAKAGGDQGELVYLAQIYGILDRFQWTKETKLFLETRAMIRQDIGAFLKEKFEDGELPELDPLLYSDTTKNYRELTGPELEAVYTALKAIETAAGDQGKILIDGKKADKEEAVAGLNDSAYSNFAIKPLPRDPNTKGAIKKAVSKAKTLDASLIKMEQWIDRLDGGDINGWWRRAIFEPICLAQYKEYELTRDMTARIAAALELMPKAIRKNLDEIIDIPGLGPVTRKWIISAGLNTGNDSNYQKMLKGEKLTDLPGIEAMAKALDVLTKEEWLFIQSVWDSLETLWPEIEAQELRLNGIAPKKVDIKPIDITLADGEVLRLRGGYYPVVYAPDESNAGKQQADAVYDEQTKRVSYPRTSTGHTKERVENFARKMLLDFESVLGRHIPKVIKDLSHREAVTSVAKLLRDERVMNSLNETIGPEYAREFWPWLLNTVNDTSGVNDPSILGWRHLLQTTRQNMVVATLGFRASSVFVQAADWTRVLVGAHAVKPQYLVRSGAKFSAEFAQYVATGGQAGFPMLDQMREMSHEMRGRAENLDRDVRGAMRRLAGKDGALAAAQRWGFKGLAIADALTSTTTWWAAFDQATAEGKNTSTAIKEADRVVRLKLMTGAPKDLTSLQSAGDMGLKFITMFMGDAINSYGITREALANIGSNKKVASSVFALLMVGIISPILADFLKNKIPEDDEDRKKYLAGKLIFGLPSSVPLLRDVVSALEGGYDYKYTPVQTVMEKFIKATKMASDLADDEKDVEWDDFFMTGMESAGLLFGIPGSGQIGTTYRYLDQLESGKRDKPDSGTQHTRNLLFGPPPKPKGGD